MRNKMIDQLFKCPDCYSTVDVVSNLTIEDSKSTFVTRCPQCESSWKYTIGISEVE